MVIDCGSLMGYVEDEKGKERQEVIGRFVHVQRVVPQRSRPWKNQQ